MYTCWVGLQQAAIIHDDVERSFRITHTIILNYKYYIYSWPDK